MQASFAIVRFFFSADMAKSSGYRMNCEAIYAISRCCVEVFGCGICFLWVFIEKIISAKHVLCKAERFSKIRRRPLDSPPKTS